MEIVLNWSGIDALRFTFFSLNGIIDENIAEMNGIGI